MIYKNEQLNEISFPLGGIGSGSIGLAGNGMLKDWEIFNRPSKGSLNGYSFFAVGAKNSEKKYCKVLNGDLTTNLNGIYSKKGFTGYGFGPDTKTMSGFPHFKNCEFDGEFPIANITFSDDDFPGEVKLTSFNPFIPLDYDNSSIPAAFFKITFTNNTDEDFEFESIFSVGNPYVGSKNTASQAGNISMITLSNPNVSKADTNYGDLTVATIGDNTFSQEYWYRGAWMDSIETFWNEFTEKTPRLKRTYDEPKENSKDTCSLVNTITVKANSSESVCFVLSWNVPTCYNYWVPETDEFYTDKTWKNYYATLFEDSKASAEYSLKNWDMLYERTLLFKDTLFSSTLDPVILDAVSSTMSVLKSPTVLRLENGEFYGWEGVHELSGSCEGTCQHVWNYAYALCFLFPELELSIRDLELDYNTYNTGEMRFRLPLPLRENLFDLPKSERLKNGPKFRACLDGQMGFIIKAYREWKISGNDQWLKDRWEQIKTILEYAWSPENADEWDKNKDGVLEGRQHHTLDMELFGPSAWLQGFYLGALKSAIEMADYLGDTEKVKEYSEIFNKGYNWTKENLFNGEYFIHKVNLNDKSIPEHFDCMNYWNSETNEIKYQIGEGSSIDQLCGQWHANILGLGRLFDEEQIKTALKNMYKYNFKPSMRTHTNSWRNYSINDDAGAVMCDYPEHVYRPCHPVPYSTETMHGFEYEMAGLLISEGFIDEGITIIKSVRDKYQGHNRNPWNEIECGNNYARSMASFAFLPLFSGFTFDLPHKKIGFNPIVNKADFKCLWSLACGWGYVEISEATVTIKILEGDITLSALELPFINEVKSFTVDGTISDFTHTGKAVTFKETTVKNEIVIEYK